MPVHRLVPSKPPEVQQLVDQLATEWRAPNPSASEPVILEEADRSGQVVHVYVIWEAWSQIDRVVRGEIIMDAAERVKTRDQVLNISIAMGLTPEEADRFKLNWRQ